MKVFDFQVYDMQDGSFFITVELSERTVYDKERFEKIKN